MSEEKEKKKLFQGFFEKLKKIKHLDIILTILFIAIILLVYFSSTGLFNSNDESQNNGTTISPNTIFDQYVESLTKEMEELISSMNGAGETHVMLYFTEGIKKEIAYDMTIETLENGKTIETKSPILITQDGKEEVVVLQEIMPEPESVIIVASGAKNANVKLEIIKLVQAMFKLSTSKIEVFAGN